MKPLNCLDIVISIYNQENIIKKVLAGVYSCTTTPYNLILVFDGCTDKTVENSQQFIDNNTSKFLKNIIATSANNVFETKANNIGFRLAKADYLITIQDDVVVEEKGWEKRLTYPLRAFDDIFAVSARMSMNIQYFGEIQPQYLNISGREYWSLPRNKFSIRNYVNRGPIAFRTDILKKLDYLDEIFAPGQFDEADLVLRAQEQYQMKCGSFSIDYRSDVNWGKTRSAGNPITSNANTTKNATLLKERHPQLLSKDGKIIEDRIINDKDIDFLVRDQLIKRWFIHLKSSKRFFIMFINRKFNVLLANIKSFLKKIYKSI